MIEPLALEVVKHPMVEWSAICTANTFDENRQLADEASDLAVRFARLAAYANGRYTRTGSDPDTAHRLALRTQNMVARQLRSALGFTYPQDDITF